MTEHVVHGTDISFSEDAEVTSAFIKDARNRVLAQQQAAAGQFQELPTYAPAPTGGIATVDDSRRGEEWSGLVNLFVGPAMRIGFFGQTLCLCLAFAKYYGEGGRRMFSFDLFSMSEKMRTSETFTFSLLCMQAGYLISCILLCVFHAFVQDNSKMTRGFRAGSKILGGAVALDLFTATLRLLQYTYAYHFLGAKWWLKYAQTKSEWCLFYTGGFLNGVALMMYGIAVFYMETYHDHGTIEDVGWINMVLFGLAGLFEITSTLTGFGAFFPLLQMLALVLATFWAFSFEPLLHRASPSLHSRDLSDVLPKPLH